MGDTAEAGALADWKLVPLTPVYLEYGGYVTAIEDALESDQDHNIVLWRLERR